VHDVDFLLPSIAIRGKKSVDQYRELSGGGRGEWEKRTNSCQPLVFVVRVPTDGHDHGMNLEIDVLQSCRRCSESGLRSSMGRVGDDSSVAVVDSSEGEIGERKDGGVGKVG